MFPRAFAHVKNHIEHAPDNVEQSADAENQLRLGIRRHLPAGWKDLLHSAQLLENPKSKDSPALAASAHRIKAHRLRNRPSSCPWENKAGSFRSPSTANSGSSSSWPLMPGGFKCLHSTQMIVFMCHKGGFLQPPTPVRRSYFSPPLRYEEYGPARNRHGDGGISAGRAILRDY